MSLTLAETITETTREFSVTGTLTDDQVPGYEFGLDDELLTLRDFGEAPITTPIEDRRFVGRDRHRWIVTRGDVPASHTSGATIRGATDAFTRSSNADVPPPFANGGGSTPTLAQVLAQGNDTGGIGIVSDATGSDTADASTTATSVDGNATATTTATASGTGAADASSTATSATGSSGVTLQAATGSTNAQIYADSVTPTSSAFADFQSGGAAQIHAEDSTTNLLNDDFFIGAGLGLQSTSTVGDGSAAPASVSSIAANSTGQVKLAVVAANTAMTNPELQVNDLPLITTGSGAPGGTFLSLLYVDTTAVTGGGYCWDFVSGAYIKIGTV